MTENLSYRSVLIEFLKTRGIVYSPVFSHNAEERRVVAHQDQSHDQQHFIGVLREC